MNPNLEQMKAERGGKCYNCRRFLRPDDQDHSFCNECWQLMVQHEYLEDAAFGPDCSICGEPKDNPLHTIKVPSQTKCLNCGGIVFVTESVDGLHSRCVDEFKEYMDSIDPRKRDDDE